VVLGFAETWKFGAAVARRGHAGQRMKPGVRLTLLPAREKRSSS
jgi:hypothetical protein